MSIPDYQTLMLPLLKRLAGRETSIPDIADPIADEFHLTAEERNRVGAMRAVGRET